MPSSSHRAVTARDKLITQMETTTASFADHVAGPWHNYDKDESAFTGPELDPSTFLDHTPQDCAGTAGDPGTRGYRFVRSLKGPGVKDPDAAVDQARAWAREQNLDEVNTSYGTRLSAGSTSITFAGKYGPKVVLDISTEHADLTVETMCSKDQSILEHITARNNDPEYQWRSPNNRFADPTDSTTPSR